MRLAAVILLLCVSVAAQNSNSIHKGAWELGIWTGGGTWVPGGTEDTQVWNAGLRVGYLLTDHFEYAVDLIPAYVVFQPVENSYGGGFTPVLLKYNFSAGKKVVPYLEGGAGLLFTNHDVPFGTNAVNFTPQAAAGLQFFIQHNRSINLAARYVHISNAGLASPNPGINTIQFTLGYHWWK
ncbi:MAG TPA: acyloxyacyl hydrolase [Terriglobales bacterium]|nr:acyloxyacyl hydrolase [Terriglobales bacterium]